MICHRTVLIYMCCDGRYSNHRVSIKIPVNESELLKPFELKCHLTDVSGKLLQLVWHLRVSLVIRHSTLHGPIRPLKAILIPIMVKKDAQQNRIGQIEFPRKSRKQCFQMLPWKWPITIEVYFISFVLPSNKLFSYSRRTQSFKRRKM